MTIIFDGRLLAQNKLGALKEEVARLRKRGTVPKLVSILVGNDPASKLYLDLKKRKAEDIGVEAEVIRLQKNIKTEKLKKIIQDLSKDEKVHGIMVQLPLPRNFSEADRDEIINTIDPQKDVDGMTDGGFYLAPVVNAVGAVLSIGEEYIRHNNYPYVVVVVGAKGFAGKKIINRLYEYNPRIYRIVGADVETRNLAAETKKADFLISITGKAGLITKDMIKEGAAVIDVGSPRGDVRKETYEKAVFVSPVPGGVGPVTISYLMENLILACERLQDKL